MPGDGRGGGCAVRRGAAADPNNYWAMESEELVRGQRVLNTGSPTHHCPLSPLPFLPPFDCAIVFLVIIRSNVGCLWETDVFFFFFLSFKVGCF